MSTYQLVPYFVSVKLHKSDETRPLDDLFAGGEQLSSELGGMLAACSGKLLVQPRVKNPRHVRVEWVGKPDERQLNIIVSPGRSGVESRIRNRAGAETPRSFTDVELMPLRHFLIYPTGGHRAVLFCERVGGSGAVTALSDLMKSMWRAKHSTSTLEIAPAMADAAMQAVIAERPIARLRLQRTQGPNGNLAIGQLDVEYVLEVKPRKRGGDWRLKNFRQDNPSIGILQEMVPVLSPTSELSREEAAAQLLEDGWSVGVTLKMKGGTRRTVNVEDNTSISMSFPIVEGEVAPGNRPDDAAVLSACKSVIQDGLVEDWGLGKGSADLCQWTQVAWQDPGGWKVGWDDVDSTAPPSAGTVSP